MKVEATHAAVDDEALLDRIKLKDSTAFNVLYDRYSERLFGYCLAATKDRELAEDIYQTTLMTVFQKAEQFKGGDFAAWMFTIARNNVRLSQRNRLQTSDIDAAFDLAGDGESPDRDIFFSGALESAIAELPDEFREVFLLKYVDGFAYHEIAEKCDISMSLVKVRIFRAKKLLRKTLQPYLS